jgi:hypothetical protein
MRRQPIFERRRLNRPRLGGPDAGRAPSLMPFGNEAARPSVLTVTPVRSGPACQSARLNVKIMRAPPVSEVPILKVPLCRAPMS